MIGKNQVCVRLAGHLEQGNLTVSVTGVCRGKSFAKKTFAIAVPPSLRGYLKQWHQDYRNLEDSFRIKNIQAEVIGTIHQRKERCQKTSQTLESEFLQWLDLPELRSLTNELRDDFPKDEPAQVFLQSEDPGLDDLPWHRWDFLARRSQTAYALSPRAFRQVSPTVLLDAQARRRILVILGQSDGLNTQRDAELFEDLPGNPIVNYFPQGSGKALQNILWEEPWDMIVFAGHSETRPEDGQGIIHLNDQESLTFDELWIALRKAVDRGLQLVIFNSCDGLGIARQLDEDLAIPQMVVMKELVPDGVAHDFLYYLLYALTQDNLPLHLAMREAQQRLQDREKDYPCASWLPVLWQNPAVESFVWQSYQPADELEMLPDLKPSSRPTRSIGWRQVMATSLVVTCLVMGIRVLGWLQGAELGAFDRLMAQRPAESVDPRITVVGITPEDLNQYDQNGYPLDDKILTQALNQIHQAKPAVVGIGIHRGKLRGSEGDRQALLDIFDKHENTIGLCRYPSPSQKQLEDENAPPGLLKNEDQLENQVGFSNLQREPDNPNSTRRYILDYDHQKVRASTHGCPSLFSFGLLLANSYVYQMEGSEFTATLDRSTLQYEKSRDHKVVFNLASKGFGGYQKGVPDTTFVLINYRQHEPPEPAFVTVTLSEILGGKVEEHLLKDRVILIGYVDGADLKPKHMTPYGEIDAILIHAHAVSHLLSTALDQRHQIWDLPSWRRWQWGDFLFVWLWATLGSVLVWQSKSASWLGIGIATSILILYWVCQLLLNQGGWLPLIPAAIALLAAGSVVAYTANQRATKPLN